DGLVELLLAGVLGDLDRGQRGVELVPIELILRGAVGLAALHGPASSECGRRASAALPRVSWVRRGGLDFARPPRTVLSVGAGAPRAGGGPHERHRGLAL